MKETVYFVMPAYNEEANIAQTVKVWHKVVEKLSAAKLVIANDGSKDGTLKVLEALKKDYSLLEVIDKPNSGHGATVMSLYKYAMEHDADYIFQTDSDGQTDPEEFWQMWEHRSAYDFQIGHRLGREDGGGRVFVTKVLRLVVFLLFHVWVKDANTPFRLMRTDRLCTIYNMLPKDFFLCNVAISAIAVRMKLRIGWYRITFRPRQGGINSINLKRIIGIGWKAIGDFYRLNKKIKDLKK